MLLYGYQEQLRLTDENVKELERDIDQVVVALFMEGKPFKIDKVGGYGGCPYERIYTQCQGETEISILNFCFTCLGANKHEEKFIETVNYRIDRLLQTKI